MAYISYDQFQSSSTSPPTLWDVFLSFRGIDTRYSFTDHLYKALHRAGIRTFKDDPELRSGEVISDSLIQAIQDSSTYIVVLSENYAASSWCLDELVEILDCSTTMKRLVIPVFYYIDPFIVRRQTGSFKDAFDKHHTRFDIEKVNKWRLMLNEVADFSGYHISKNRSQADIIDEVVDRVLLEINPVTLNVAKYPVGLDSRVKGVTALFNSDTEGVIRIGIHGMGGVGKTTLAKAVYNQNYQRFKGSCFLANVREVSGMTNGLVTLQQQLIVDVLRRNNINIGNVDQGIELIRARICSTKVLVVIDDLDDPKPLEYLEGSFALGSMVIITTRNEDLLDRIRVKAKYKVNRMDEYESHQLFTKHAFGYDKVSDTFTKLSKEILERAGGLPLALQVFGSNLLNKSEEGWRSFIDKLKRVPIDDVEKNLMLSFDALKSVDPMLQDIFLDIACFYVGQRKAKAVEIMETFYPFVNRNIEILQKRCLITISDQDRLGMHDLLRDMGREIARNNSPNEPGKYSRLWDKNDTYSILKNDKGTEAIQGIIFADSMYYHRTSRENPCNRVSIAAQTFRRMSKLRFLDLSNVHLSGSFGHTFEDLRWLYWKHCPLFCLPSDFHTEKLVVLELPYSQMRTMCGPNMVFDKLKTLNMSFSPNLTTTPDFTRLPCLESLNLEYCKGLEEVHISIGSLVRLVSLNLGYCSNLRSLPDTICSLRKLEVLIIAYCKSLKALPIKFGNIESLKVLKATSLIVSILPDSIGRLCNLVVLDLSQNMNLGTLPDSICNLRSLKILYIEDCENLGTLPAQLGKITSLRKLEAKRATLLRMLPDISQLLNIRHLDLNGCRHLLSIAGLPHNLTRIRAIGCMSIKRLPNLSNLKHLRELNLTYCSGLTEIQGLEKLTSLEVLKLTGCNLSSLLAYSLTKRFFQVSQVFANLKVLNMSDFSNLTTTPDFTILPCLETLNLNGCTRLEDVHISVGSLMSLVSLDLGGCSSLRSLPDSICSLRTLEVLTISGCSNLEALPSDIGNIKSLNVLNAWGQTVSKLPESIGRLSNLLELNLYCSSLETLPDTIGNLRSLKILDISECRKLEVLPDQLGMITSLKELYARKALLKILPDIGKLLKIKYLDLSGCCHLLSIAELPVNLKWITADGCTAIERLPNLANLKQLRKLDLKNCSAMREIPGLEEITSLEDLNIRNCGKLLSIPEIAPNQCIEAKGCTSMKLLPNLSNLKQMTKLDLTSCSALTEIQGLEELNSLIDLNLSDCGHLLFIPELPPNLKWMKADGCSSIERLPNLSNLKQLMLLDLEDCRCLTEILGLEGLISLDILNLSHCENLQSIPELAPNLKWIVAEGCKSIRRLPNLSNLKQLSKLDLRGCSGLIEIQGWEELTSLKVLDLRGCNSSLLAYTLAKRIFQIFCGIGHAKRIYISPIVFLDWDSQSSKSGSKISLDLQNFLAMIFCSKLCGGRGSFDINDSIKNTTSDFIRRDSLCFNYGFDSYMVMCYDPEVLCSMDPSRLFQAYRNRKI